MEAYLPSKLFLLLIFPLIALISWGLFKVFPAGKLKVLLFKIRGVNGGNESKEEKRQVAIITCVLIFGFYAFLYFMLKAYS
ncbi:hypothetical protein ACFOEK_20760 [Litoribrevibacter euphylliae]|uniref:Uncharacterized protein n=1 Tax=Litoribrevibacter euphylliae TaxID=1834034 RepID=A0ABV7HHY0_9GAMM